MKLDVCCCQLFPLSGTWRISMQLLKILFIKVIFGKAEDGSWRYCSSLIQAHLGIFLSTFAIVCCAITWPKKKRVGSRWKVIYLATEERKENNFAQLKLFCLFPQKKQLTVQVSWTLTSPKGSRGTREKPDKDTSPFQPQTAQERKHMSLRFMEKWQITISYKMADGLHSQYQVDI